MAQYGFKIFQVERMNGTGNTPVPFLDSTWGNFTDHLRRSYQRQLGRKWHQSPREAFDEDGNLLPLDPNSRIVRLDWVETSGMSTFFSFSSGKNDGFVDAMTAAEGGPDVSIGHLAPRRQYRGVYTLPPGQTEGVLVLEVITRSCPITVLTNWTNRWSQDLAEADLKEKKDSKHCRMRVSQLTDTAQVSSLLSSGDPQEIVLIEHTSQGHGLPNIIQYRLTARVRQKSDAMATVKGWVQKSVGMNKGISEAKALVGPQIGNAQFDDCYVAVQHEGQTQHVRPDTYSELYIYDSRSSQRETDDFYKRANEKLASLGLTKTMELDLTNWPSGLPKLHG